jgi:predicted nucleic acid-binding protein
MRPQYAARLVLDTSVLLSWWRRRRQGRRYADIKKSEISQWGKQLAELHQTDAIVTPVYVEMLAGTSDRRELAFTRLFLDCFRCIDEQRTPAVDWEEAIRLAGRIPRQPRPRDLGDCLIRAIANRLNYGVLTHDAGFAV